MPDPARRRVEVLVEVPRGGFIKRELHGAGRVDYLSPLPCPFNYGCVPGLPGPDGDPADAILLGPRRPLGARVPGAVVGVVRFWDAGLPDDKLLVGEAPPTAAQLRQIRLFFTFYGPIRRVLNALRGRGGRTGLVAVEATGG